MQYCVKGFLETGVRAGCDCSTHPMAGISAGHGLGSQSAVLGVACQVCPGHCSATLTLFAVTVCCSPWDLCCDTGRGDTGIKCRLVSGTEWGIELTQKKCLSLFYQKAEETFNPLIF